MRHSNTHSFLLSANIHRKIVVVCFCENKNKGKSTEKLQNGNEKFKSKNPPDNWICVQFHYKFIPDTIVVSSTILLLMQVQCNFLTHS